MTAAGIHGWSAAVWSLESLESEVRSLESEVWSLESGVWGLGSGLVGSERKREQLQEGREKGKGRG